MGRRLSVGEASSDLNRCIASVSFSFVLELTTFLRATREWDGSDLHLMPGQRPYLRRENELRSLADQPLDVSELTRALESCLDEISRHRLDESGHVTLVLERMGRFRLEIQRVDEGLGAVFRAIAESVPALGNFRTQRVGTYLAECVREPFGLGLVTGPSGSGRSTTVAAILSHVIQNRAWVVVTIEDPPEYILEDAKGRVRQLSVGIDEPSQESALRAVDGIDLVYAGELSSLRILELALDLTASGCSIIATLSTRSMTESLHFLINLFPDSRVNEARARLAERLGWVVSQKLVPTCDVPGRVAAFECLPFFLDSGAAYRRRLRAGPVERLYQEMQLSTSNYRPLTMEMSLAALYFDRRISLETALAASHFPDELTSRINQTLFFEWMNKKLSLEEALAASPRPDWLRERARRWEQQTDPVTGRLRLPHRD